MNQELIILLSTAASIGFFHTLLGPDHYLPFIVLSKARQWSLRKTIMVTGMCGLGHVIGSVVLGVIGVVLGIAVNKLEVVESLRGGLAAWILLSFGLVYFIWGLRRAIKNRSHTHLHSHTDGSSHKAEHTHHGEHAHVHENPVKSNLTPWVLFTVFVFGPCEPLIPILMYPAAQNSWFAVLLVAGVFSVATILTMTVIVFIAALSMSYISFGKVERYSHALAGMIIFISGAGIVFLGL